MKLADIARFEIGDLSSYDTLLIHPTTAFYQRRIDGEGWVACVAGRVLRDSVA